MTNVINLQRFVNNKNADKAYKTINDLEINVLQFLKEKGINPHQVPNLNIALAVLKGTIDAYYGQETDLVNLLKLSVSLQQEIDDLEGRRMI